MDGCCHWLVVRLICIANRFELAGIRQDLISEAYYFEHMA